MGIPNGLFRTRTPEFGAYTTGGMALSASEGNDSGARWGSEATQVLPAHSGRAVRSWSSQGVAMKSRTQQKRKVAFSTMKLCHLCFQTWWSSSRWPVNLESLWIILYRLRGLGCVRQVKGETSAFMGMQREDACQERTQSAEWTAVGRNSAPMLRSCPCWDHWHPHGDMLPRHVSLNFLASSIWHR